MIRMMAVLHRRPDLSAEEFRRYWRKVHGPIAARIPGLRRLVQYHAQPDPTRAACDGIVELWFDDRQAMDEAWASPEGRASDADLANFLDTGRSGTVLVEEVRIV